MFGNKRRAASHAASAPVRGTATQAAPVQAGPIQAAPVQAGPIQAGPLQVAPARGGPPPGAPAFASFFQGGFECSTHRRRDGRQLDLIAGSGHDARAADDYRMLRECGIATVRDGLRWHRIEAAPGRYDWSSFQPMLQAACRNGTQVIWDLCHYGLPHDLDIAGQGFVDRFAAFAAAAARLIRAETGAAPLLCPVNEMSFWAWAGGDHTMMFPCKAINGPALKRQLVSATIAAIDAVRAVEPEARFIQAEPLIHVAARPGHPEDDAHARSYSEIQFEATDMLTGRIAPELGGTPGHLDVLGLNFYSDNQWTVGGAKLPLGHRLFRPLRTLLHDAHARYRRPLLITETGAEAGNGPGWLGYVAGEVRAALRDGLPVSGICLYPVLDYPGWDNGRHCRCGLLASGPDWGARTIDADLAARIEEERILLEPLRPAAPLRPARAPDGMASGGMASGGPVLGGPVLGGMASGGI